MDAARAKAGARARADEARAVGDGKENAPEATATATATATRAASRPAAVSGGSRRATASVPAKRKLVPKFSYTVRKS